MKSRASQSSSSGCEGSWPWLPKSSGVATIPRPKIDCHQRLTVTRAVSGCFGSVTHRARPSRLRGQSGEKGSRAAGVSRETGSVGAS